MPDGESSISGTDLVFTDVNRHYAGVYMCTANNGFGTEASDKITLDVSYPPEVSVGEVFVHAKTGNKVELVCEVSTAVLMDTE